MAHREHLELRRGGSDESLPRRGGDGEDAPERATRADRLGGSGRREAHRRVQRRELCVWMLGGRDAMRCSAREGYRNRRRRRSEAAGGRGRRRRRCAEPALSEFFALARWGPWACSRGARSAERQRGPLCKPRTLDKGGNEERGRGKRARDEEASTARTSSTTTRRTTRAPCGPGEPVDGVHDDLGDDDGRAASATSRHVAREARTACRRSRSTALMRRRRRRRAGPAGAGRGGRREGEGGRAKGERGARRGGFCEVQTRGGRASGGGRREAGCITAEAKGRKERVQHTSEGGGDEERARARGEREALTPTPLPVPRRARRPA